MRNIIKRGTCRAAAAFVGTVAAGVLVLVAAAFACTPTNLISVDTPSGTPGTELNLTGSVLTGNEVTVHWDGTDGPILTRATPAAGRISASFTVPDVAPGYYALVAVQPDAYGNELVARAGFQVAGPGRAAQAASYGSPASAGRSPSLALAVGLGLIASAAGLGSLGLVLAGRRRQPVGASAPRS